MECRGNSNGRTEIEVAREDRLVEKMVVRFTSQINGTIWSGTYAYIIYMIVCGFTNINNLRRDSLGRTIRKVWRSFKHIANPQPLYICTLPDQLLLMQLHIYRTLNAFLIILPFIPYSCFHCYPREDQSEGGVSWRMREKTLCEDDRFGKKFSPQCHLNQIFRLLSLQIINLLLFITSSCFYLK